MHFSSFLILMLLQNKESALSPEAPAFVPGRRGHFTLAALQAGTADSEAAASAKMAANLSGAVQARPFVPGTLCINGSGHCL